MCRPRGRFKDDPRPVWTSATRSVPGRRWAALETRRAASPRRWRSTLNDRGHGFVPSGGRNENGGLNRERMGSVQSHEVTQRGTPPLPVVTLPAAPVGPPPSSTAPAPSALVLRCYSSGSTKLSTRGGYVPVGRPARGKKSADSAWGGGPTGLSRKPAPWNSVRSAGAGVFQRSRGARFPQPVSGAGAQNHRQAVCPSNAFVAWVELQRASRWGGGGRWASLSKGRQLVVVVKWPLRGMLVWKVGPRYAAALS